MELIRAEAWAYVVKDDLGAAEKLLTKARDRHPDQATPWETLFDIYLNLDKISNAVAVLDQQLKSQPKNPRALINYGALKMRTGHSAEEALPYLDRALEINPKDEDARLNRALANLMANRFDAAQQDYETLLNSGVSYNRLDVLFGLAETYYHKKNRKESLKYYDEFLKIAPAGMPQIPMIKQRIKLLESGGAF
jgi:tetratricopeptide (TPR) repeat protein